MDTEKNTVTNDDIKELIDNLDKISITETYEDTISVSANSWADLHPWLNTANSIGSLSTITSLSPLSTSQLSSILPYQNSTTASQTTTYNLPVNGGGGSSGAGLLGNALTGAILTSGSGGNLSWNSPSLEVKGDANFDGDINIKGKSLNKTLESIEKRLGILHVNPDLEKRWEKLKQLSEEYQALEQELLSTEEMFKTLKN